MLKETFGAIVDAVVSILFIGGLYFSVPKLYEFVTTTTVKRVNFGLSSTYGFTKALTDKKFSWESNGIKK